jgi:YVTN family beta-propeller protein
MFNLHFVATGNFNVSLIKTLKHFGFIAFLLLSLIPSLLNAQTVVDSIKRGGLWPAGLAVYETGNKLCVFDDRTNHLLVYDENTFVLLKEIVFTKPIYDPDSFGGMIIDEIEGKLFVCIGIAWGSPDRVRVAVVDLIGDSILTEIPIPSLLPQSVHGFVLDQAINKIYLNNNYDLFVVDLGTEAVLKITLPGLHSKTGLSVNPITHEVFLTDTFDGDKLFIIDGITYNITQIDAPFADAMAYNWQENKVYIITIPFRIWIYDCDTGEEKWIEHHNDSEQMYYNPGGNNVYTSAEIACRTTIINGSDDNFFNLQVAGGLPAMGFRYETKHTYFVNHNHIGVYDEISQMFEKIEFNNPHSYMTSGRYLIAVNQTNGRIYVTFSSGYNAPDYSPIWILQDTEMFTRPNVFLSDNYSLGYYPPIEILDPLTHNLVEYWGIQYDLRGIAFRPDGGRTYISVDEYGTGKFEVHAGSGAWDLFGRGAGNMNALVGSIELGNVDPKGIVTSPDQPLVYVVCSATNKVKIIDVANDTLLSVINELDAGTNPKAGAITADGSYGFITNAGSNDVTIFNAQTNTVIGTTAVGTAPWGIAINPGSRFVYVANSGSNTVSVIDVNTRNVNKTINVGTTPHNIVFSQDGKYAFVTNNGNGTVSVIDAGTHTVINNLTVGPHPDGICVYPDGSRIYVATDTVASIISLSDLSVSQISYVSAYHQKKTIAAVADPTARFAGQIINANGAAVTNAVIKAYQSGIEKGSTTANSSGDFCIYNLMKGNYDIEVTASNHYSQNLTSLDVGSGRTKICNFNLVPYAPSEPILSSPLNNSLNQPVDIPVVFYKSENANMYHLQIAYDSLFASLVYDDSTITDSVKQIIVLNNNTKYFWHVRAKNISGYSDWSDVWNFTTIISSPNIPILSSPTNNLKNQPFNLELSWYKVSTAIGYHLQLSSKQNFTDFFINDSTLVDTTKKDITFSEGQKYYWRVRAKNIGGNSPFSDVWNFTTLLIKPDSLNAINDGPNKVKLSWKDMSSSESGFIVERKTTSSNFSIIDTVAANSIEYIDLTVLGLTEYHYRLNCFNDFTVSDYSNETGITTITSVADNNQPLVYSLLQNYPNPFNPTTKLGFGIMERGNVRLSILNILGKEIRVLLNEDKEAGYHSIEFNASNLPSGVYFYQLKAGSFVETKKMILLR